MLMRIWWWKNLLLSSGEENLLHWIYQIISFFPFVSRQGNSMFSTWHVQMSINIYPRTIFDSIDLIYVTSHKNVLFCEVVIEYRLMRDIYICSMKVQWAYSTKKVFCSFLFYYLFFPTDIVSKIPFSSYIFISFSS